MYIGSQHFLNPHENYNNRNKDIVTSVKSYEALKPFCCQHKDPVEGFFPFILFMIPSLSSAFCCERQRMSSFYSVRKEVKKRRKGISHSKSGSVWSCDDIYVARIVWRPNLAFHEIPCILIPWIGHLSGRHSITTWNEKGKKEKFGNSTRSSRSPTTCLWLVTRGGDLKNEMRMEEWWTTVAGKSSFFLMWLTLDWRTWYMPDGMRTPIFSSIILIFSSFALDTPRDWREERGPQSLHLIIVFFSFFLIWPGMAWLHLVK